MKRLFDFLTAVLSHNLNQNKTKLKAYELFLKNENIHIKKKQTPNTTTFLPPRDKVTMEKQNNENV